MKRWLAAPPLFLFLVGLAGINWPQRSYVVLEPQQVSLQARAAQISCKLRSRTAQALTMDELATFTALSFVHCKGSGQTIVAHPAEKPIENRRYMGIVSEIGLERWYDIDAETWENMQKLGSGDDVVLNPLLPPAAPGSRDLRCCEPLCRPPPRPHDHAVRRRQVPDQSLHRRSSGRDLYPGSRSASDVDEGDDRSFRP